MTNAAGFDVSFFGLFDLPKLFVDNELTMQLASKTHSILVNAITILLILHILAAAKHHFMDRDNTLRNMFLVNAGNAFYYLILSSAIMLLLTFSWHILTKKEVNHQTHESAHEQAHSQEHGMGDKPHDSLTH